MNTTKLIWLTASVCGAILVTALTTYAGKEMKMVTIGGDDVDGTAMIAELGALVFEEDSTLTVEHVMDASQRPKAYQEIDLKQGDIILMVNGKRAQTADELTSILDSLDAGDDIKFGIRRDKAMQIVSFKKAAPEDLPKVKMVTRTMSDDEGDKGHGGKQMKKISIGGGDAESDGQLAVLMDSGLIFKQDGDAVIVLATMPHTKEALGDVEVTEGDRILKLQDKDITNPAMLQELYDAIEIGESVTIVLARDGKEFEASFLKEKAPENIMIKGQ